MRKVFMALAGAAFLAATGGALADGANVVRSHNLEVKQRLAHLERIDVTAEKPANPKAEPLDEELLAILDDLEQIEQQAPGDSDVR